MNQQEQLAIRIRHVLGEYNNDDVPVVNLVFNLARMNREQAKLLGAFQGMKDNYIKEGFRAGLARAMEILEKERLDIPPGQSPAGEMAFTWANDTIVDALGEIRAELEGK